ncbi:hypothetical protein [Thermococcus prieurii]
MSTGTPDDVKIIELHIYHTEFSDEPIHRAIVVTRNAEVLVREVKRALAVMSKENFIKGEEVAALVKTAVRRSNSVELETIKVRIVMSKL